MYSKRMEKNKTRVILELPPSSMKDIELIQAAYGDIDRTAVIKIALAELATHLGIRKNKALPKLLIT